MYKQYLLTLKGADQGKVRAKAQLLTAGLGEVEIFYGIDGRELSAKEYYEFMVGTRSYVKHGQIFTPGEVGCALSHIMMLQQFLNSTEEIAIIFEDDVLIEDQSISKLKKALQFIEPTDILVACNQQGIYPDNFRAVPIGEHAECYTVQKDDWGIVKRTCAYALGRAAAKYVLAIQNEALCLADDYQSLCAGDGRLLFCDAFSHLATYDGSTIDIERHMQRPAPRSLMLRLKDEIMKTISSKSAPARRAIRSALGGYRVVGKK